MFQLNFLKLVLHFIFKLTLEPVFSIAFFSLNFPFIFLFHLLNQFIRLIISILIYYKHGKSVRLSTNGLDNIWGYETTGNGRNVLFVTIYSEIIDCEVYKNTFESTVINFEDKSSRSRHHPYSKLRKKFTSRFGYYCWEEDKTFDIENHILILRNKVYNENDLFELLSKLSADFDGIHPQWEEILIERYEHRETPGSSAEIVSARILRFHHAYGDAGSWLLLYSYTMANGSIPYSVNPLVGYKVSCWEKCAYYLSCIIFSGSHLFKCMIRRIQQQSQVKMRDYTGVKYFEWSETIDMGILKEIKVKTKSSIATIIVSAIGNLLNGDRALEIGIVAAILPYPNLNLTNRFTIANLQIPENQNKVPRITRLKKTHATGMKLAKSPEPYLNYLMFRQFGSYPTFLQNWFMKSANSDVIFSNLPGAKESFVMHNDVVHSGGAWVPLLTTAGLTISACGYKDQLKLCGSTDAAVMDKYQLKQLLNEIIQEIRLIHSDCFGIV